MRKPNHPGRILQKLYLQDFNITITDFAEAIGVSRKAVSSIINERKSITPEMSLRLSKALDTTPDLWLNLQKKYDLWNVINNTVEWKNVVSVRETFGRMATSPT